MSDEIAITVTVNGQVEHVRVEPRQLLVHLLRDDLGLPLDRVVLNALLPDRLTGAEATALQAAEGSRAARVARHHHRRAKAQRAQAARLRSALGGEVPLTTLPYLFRSAIGPDDLQQLSGRMR